MAEMNPGPGGPDADDRSAGEGPIFVVGSMRSGSTLLRLVLDSHPRIAIGAETGFMGALRGMKEIPAWRYGKGWYQRLDWTDQEIDERLREFYAGMFRRYTTEQGKQRWGDKTPFHTGHMVEMGRVFPDAVFVGIVRHPGAVATSLRKNFHYTFPDAVSYWLATNLELVRSGIELGGRFVACRYEDLVADSEPVLRELLDFLGEPWSPAVLAHHDVQRDKRAPRVVDGSTVSHDPIDPSRTAAWSRSVTDDDRRALQAAAGLGGFFGYHLSDGAAGPWLPTTSTGRPWTATGEDLAARTGEWRDQVDFDERPPTAAVDASPEELAERLARAERALARVRSRRAVRLADAVRRVQRGRSPRDVAEAWSILRGTHTERHGLR
jgi:hypothetical protein